MNIYKWPMDVKTQLFLSVTVLMLMPFTIVAQTSNPALPGFNKNGSDLKAIEIADEVMNKMGGRENWDNTRFITWKFFGKRLHVWDKWTGNIRLESENLIVLMNIHTQKGRAWENGIAVTQPDSLKKQLQYGYEAWINDSYWVFMPYKLKDSGVTLRYKGVGEIDDNPADILTLTFEGIGVTPENKYEVYVDQKTKLVKQWAYFKNAKDKTAGMTTPWSNWQNYGNILLSNDRGKYKHTDIAVFDELPVSVFEDPGPVDMLIEK